MLIKGTFESTLMSDMRRPHASDSLMPVSLSKALLSDTGIRLSEACGLLISDINVDSNVPFISIQPHQWRSLKTSSSKRTVPLVGASLWSAKRIVSNASSEFAFPRYCSPKGHKALCPLGEQYRGNANSLDALDTIRLADHREAPTRGTVRLLDDVFNERH